MKFDEKIDEIYESFKRSARGVWRYDETTMKLVIHLDDQNIIKANIPKREVGAFIANAPNYVSLLLESVYTHRDIALQLLPKDLQDKYLELVSERLSPSEKESDPNENETKKITAPA